MLLERSEQRRARSRRVVRGHSGSFGVVQGLSGSFGVVWGRSGSFRVIRGVRGRSAEEGVGVLFRDPWDAPERSKQTLAAGRLSP